MNSRTPATKSPAYQAAALIHRTGPIPRDDLLECVEFSTRPCNAGQALSAAIRSGWLSETPEGVTLSDISRHHFGPQRVESAYVGVKAGKREPLTPLHLRPALKYKTDSSGSNVRDIDARFQRPEGHHFFTVSSGVA
jgi:hypothetical protein